MASQKPILKKKPTISYTLYLYREELKKLDQKPLRSNFDSRLITLNQTKFVLTDKLIADSYRSKRNCSLDYLKIISREIEFKKKLERQMERIWIMQQVEAKRKLNAKMNINNQEEEEEECMLSDEELQLSDTESESESDSSESDDSVEYDLILTDSDEETTAADEQPPRRKKQKIDDEYDTILTDSDEESKPEDEQPPRRKKQKTTM